MEQDDEVCCDTTVRPDSIIIEFLEVSIHQLLFIHQIYPAGIFSRKQKYGVPVQVSGHPQVNNYITQCLKTALELLKQSELTKLILVFCLDEGKYVKKIVFDVKSLQQGITLARQNEERLEIALRDIFLRLSVSDRVMQPLPKGCTFKVLLETSEQSHINMSKNTSLRLNQEFPWTRSNPRQLQLPFPHIIPLGSLNSCNIELNIYAEEMQKT